MSGSPASLDRLLAMLKILHKTRLLVVAVLLCAVAALVATAATPARVVAVADVHGDLRGLQAILRAAAVIDPAGRWAGGTTILVQTGDLIDRGPDSRAVLEFMMALERQAGQAGGQVIVLLGNHEAMNIIGDLRYVTDAGFAAYGNKRSEQRRRDAWQQYAKWLKDHGAAALAATVEREWLANHPIGFVEQREAFGPRGRYGRWLRQRPVIAKVGDTLFVHGGISGPVATLPVDRINARAAEELRAFDQACDELQARDRMPAFFTLNEIVQRATAVANAVGQAASVGAGGAGGAGGQGDAIARAGWPGVSALLKQGGWLIVNDEGPLWFRGFADWSDDEGALQVSAILEKQAVSRVVVGHSPQESGRIRMRWDGRVFLIDTGLLQGYEPGGRASALEIDGTRITAIYLDGRVLLTHIPVRGEPAEPRTWRSHRAAPHLSAMR